MKTNTFLNRIFTLTLSIPLLIIVGCTDAPKQYGTETPPAVNPSEIRPDMEHKIEISGDLFQNTKDNDSFTRENSLKPIYYKEKMKNKEGDEILVNGAAGILMTGAFQEDVSTTFEKAEAMMEKTSWTRNYINGSMYVYPSGIVVLWRKGTPRVPVFIQLQTSYQGALKVPGEIGELKFKREYTQFFTENEEGKLGQSFITKLYNALNEKDSAFNCLNPGSGIPPACRVLVRPAEIVFIWPGFVIAFAKDRKTLFFMSLSRAVNNGNLSSEFDLTKGTLLVDPENLDSPENIKLGDTWGGTYEKLNKNIKEGEPEVNSLTSQFKDFFLKDFTGISLGINKSEFGRTYIEPDSGEILSGIEIAGGFQKLIRVNSNYIEIVNSEIGFEFLSVPRVMFKLRSLWSSEDPQKFIEGLKKSTSSLVPLSVEQIYQILNHYLVKEFESSDPFGPSFKKPVEHNYLSVGTAIDGEEKQQKFVGELTKLLTENIATSEGDVILAKKSGFHKNTSQKTFKSAVVQYDQANDKGKLISFDFSQESGQLDSILVALWSNQFNKLVIPAIQKPLEDNGEPVSSLAGFELGSSLTISEIDSGRYEATVHYKKDDYSMVSRAQYNKNDNLDVVAVDGDRARKKGIKVHSLLFGDIDVKVSVVPHPTEKDTFTIVGVATDWQIAGIGKLCGVTLNAALGMKDSEFQTTLSEALKSAKVNPKDCFRAYKSEVEPSRNGIYYFPNEGVAIGFDNRELTTVFIYSVN